MIRHMIFWDLADPNMDRSELAAFLKSTFDPMVGAVPGLRCAHIGFDQGMGTHDVGLCCDLDSLEALAAYQDYPPMWPSRVGPRNTSKSAAAWIWRCLNEQSA